MGPKAECQRWLIALAFKLEENRFLTQKRFAFCEQHTAGESKHLLLPSACSPINWLLTTLPWK